MEQPIDLRRAADELTAYAAQRLVDFEQRRQGRAYRQPETRNEWVRDILRGMAAVCGEDSEPYTEALNQRLEAAHGCFAVETLPQPEQKDLVNSLSRYAAALERQGDDQRRRVFHVRRLLEDMCAYLPWNPNEIGIYPVRDQVESELVRMTARRHILFTRVLLGGETGPSGEDFLSGSVTDASDIHSTVLFDRLTSEYPEVEEWPAICTAYVCGGQAVPTVPKPADELDLQIIRDKGVRFLDRPEISFAGLHEFRVPVPEQEPNYEWVLNSL